MGTGAGYSLAARGRTWSRHMQGPRRVRHFLRPKTLPLKGSSSNRPIHGMEEVDHGEACQSIEEQPRRVRRPGARQPCAQRKLRKGCVTSSRNATFCRCRWPGRCPAEQRLRHAAAARRFGTIKIDIQFTSRSQKASKILPSSSVEQQEIEANEIEPHPGRAGRRASSSFLIALHPLDLPHDRHGGRRYVAFGCCSSGSRRSRCWTRPAHRAPQSHRSSLPAQQPVPDETDP